MADLPARPWKRELCQRMASALRLRALSATTVREKLEAIGDELLARGDLDGAARQYAAAGAAARIEMTDGGTKPATTWTEMIAGLEQLPEPGG